MRNSLRTLLVTLVCLGCVAPVLAQTDYGYVSRSWKNPGAPMQLSMSVQVPVTVIGPNGQPQTSYQTQWVHVQVLLNQPAQLRVGEVEYFRVSAYPNGQSIGVHVDPDLVYHSYYGSWSSTGSFGGYVRLYLNHNGRIKNLPPASFEKVNVAFTTPEAPFTMTIADLALADNAEAQTRYSFEIQRKVFLFPNKLVAKGELAAPAQGAPTVVITKDSPFAQAGVEYFKDGKDYLIVLKLQRLGSSYYTEGWSPEARYTFTWKNGAAVLEREDVQAPRERTRTEKFQDLHKD